MRRTTQLASGFLVHLVLGLLLATFVARHELSPAPAPVTKALVWAPHAGTGGGGRGGDGVKASPAPRIPTQPVERFALPSMPAVVGGLELPGTAVLSAAMLTGTGRDDGRNDGRGEGIDGPGAGRGQGTGNGEGEGAFLDGMPGVASPRLLFERRPDYTAQAMAARVEGRVLLEATVLPDGSVGDVHVVRSLDGRFGLDQKAVEAVRQWKFRPGTHLGKPAAVKVLIELFFTLQ